MQSKGISPVIGVVLLVLVVVVVWAIFSGWLLDFTEQQIEQSQETGERQIRCGEAGITIVSCSYDKGNTEVVQATVENTGSVILEGIKIIANYTDGSSDVADEEELTLDLGQRGNVFITADENKTVETVTLIALNCDIARHNAACD